MESEVLDRLHEIGLVVERLEFGHLVRVPVSHPNADRGGKKSGWYVLQEYTSRDGRSLIFGVAGNWKAGSQIKIEPDSQPLSKEERQEMAARHKAAQRAAEAERKAKAREAEKRANRVWPKLPEQGNSEYLDRKQVKGFGVRFARGTIVVPVRRASDDRLVGLQWIAGDGSKRFLTGTPKQGACHVIGDLKADAPLLIAEGYATGASLHMATGVPVAVAFDAGNLVPVAKSLRKRWPKRHIVIAGDDDHETEGNPGKTKAEAAAEAVHGGMILPEFEKPKGRSDFNDMHCEQGIKALRRAVKDRLKSARDESLWKRRLLMTEKGSITVALHNLALIMEHDPRLSGLLRMDEFANRVELTREPPFGGEVREITDVEVAELAAWFGRPEAYRLNVPTGLMHEAVAMVAARDRYHPVREYLDSLTWDGIERIPTLFSDHFNARQDEYTRQVGLNFLIQAVARVRDPGCKADLMLIFEGEQGVGKSSSVQALCGWQWFSEALEPPESKDFYQALIGRWIVEIAELQSFSKAQVSRVKNAISVPADVYRPSYGRMARAHLRQCVFVGTTNDDEYLRDATGARRFMPIRVGTVDVETLEQLRDQLWAEADVRYQRGEPYWLLPAQAEQEREARYMYDSWEEPIGMWLDGDGAVEQYPDGPARQLNEVSIDQVLKDCLGMDRARHNRQEQMRISAILKRMGWKRQLRRRGSRRVWLYTRPDEAGPDRTEAEA